MGAQGGGEQESGGCCLLGVEFPFGRMKNRLEIGCTTILHTIHGNTRKCLRRLIVCYLCFAA